MSTPEGFDRLRRRGHGPTPSGGPAPSTGPAPLRMDPEGRSALYSVSTQGPPPGAVTVTCSECEQTTTVSPQRLAVLAVPSVHLPLLRKDHPSWMRCPACRRRTWVKVVITL